MEYKTYKIGEIVKFGVNVKNTGTVPIGNITVNVNDTQNDPEKLNPHSYEIPETLNPSEISSTEYFYHTVSQKDIETNKIIEYLGEIVNASFPEINDYELSEFCTSDIASVNKFQAITPKLLISVSASNPANNSEYILGETITFTITVENTGNVNFSQITLNDGKTITNFKQNNTKSFIFTHVVTFEDIRREYIEYFSNVESYAYSEEIVKNPEIISGYIKLENIQKIIPELITNAAIISEPQNIDYDLGDIVKIQITVSNPISSIPISSVNVKSKLNDETENVGDLQPGNYYSYIVNHAITEEDILQGYIEENGIVNSYIIDASTGFTINDISITENGCRENNIVTPNPELTIRKVEKEISSAKIGNNIVYDLFVKNTGNITLNNLNVIEEVLADTYKTKYFSGLYNRETYFDYYTTAQETDNNNIGEIQTIAPNQEIKLQSNSVYLDPMKNRISVSISNNVDETEQNRANIPLTLINDEPLSKSLYDTFQYVINTEATTAGEKISSVPLQLFKQMPDIIINVDWGDGITSILTSESYETENDCISSLHEYSQPGTYTITITSHDWYRTFFDTCTFIGGSSQYEPTATAAEKLNLYYFERTLIKINTRIPSIAGCQGFRSSINNIHRTAETNFIEGIFKLTRNLKSIPEDLFASYSFSQVTNFGGIFNCCSNLEEIPEHLFDNCINMINLGIDNRIGYFFIVGLSDMYLLNIPYSYAGGAFANCYAITSLPENLFKNNTKLTNLAACFQYCHKLKTIPKNLFKYNTQIKTFISTFAYCLELETIPAHLFDYNEEVLAFSACFRNCIELKSIPDNLFINNHNVMHMNSVFSGCKELMNIPTGLFDSLNEVISYNNVFYDCINLQSIPSGLFDNSTKVISFEESFKNCISLTSIPSNLFDNCTEALSFIGTFSGPYGTRGSFTVDGITYYTPFCPSTEYMKIQEIPQDLFKYNVNAITFEECFVRNNAITTIPEHLFDTNVLVNDGRNNYNYQAFRYTFGYCIALETIPENLFKYNTAVTLFNNTFCYCTSLQNIPTNLFKYNTEVTTFGSTFSNCTSLIAIPTNIFKFNINALYFSSTFGYCSSLTSIPENLFEYNVNATTFNNTFTHTGINTIPVNLFKNNPEAVSFNYTFENCNNYGLEYIPSNLFKYNAKAENFNYTFSWNRKLENNNVSSILNNTFTINNKTYSISDNNVKLNGNAISEINNHNKFIVDDIEYTIETNKIVRKIPENLFKYNVNAKTFTNTFYQTSLEYIPDDLFKYNVNAISFIGTFECTSLKYIPEHLFDNCTEVTSFMYCFALSTYSGEIPENLFKYNRKITSFAYCFEKYMGTSIPENLFKYNTEVTSFSGLFYGINYTPNLVNIPENLFKYNTNVEDFSLVFSGCSNLINIPDNIFSYSTEIKNISNAFYNSNKIGNLNLLINSPNITNVTNFVTKNTANTRIINVPVNSTTQSTFNNVASSLGLEIITH